MKTKRIIGQYNTESDGPMLIFVAGVHGNEMSGVQALIEVFRILEDKKPHINGSVVGLAGNLKALESEVRYIDEDLNRVWLTESDDQEISELHERDELADELGNLFPAKEREINFFDLHSTSAESSPFIMLSDTLRNRALAGIVGVPILLGLMEHLQGTLMETTSRSGFPTFLFQGGREGDENTLQHHLGLIWKVLKVKGGLDTSEIRESELSISKLDSFASKTGDPEFLEIPYTYEIEKGIDFAMKPGYVNFQTIRNKEVVAVADGQDVRVPFGGQIFMPLYQKQGEEGFYMVRLIGPFWIRLSRKMRRFKFHEKLNWLVGVSKTSSDPLTFRLDLQVAFLWAEKVFHLLGYVRVGHGGHSIYMARSEDERNPPTSQEAIREFTTKSYYRIKLKRIESDWKIPFSQTENVNKE